MNKNSLNKLNAFIMDYFIEYKNKIFNKIDVTIQDLDFPIIIYNISDNYVYFSISFNSESITEFSKSINLTSFKDDIFKAIENLNNEYALNIYMNNSPDSYYINSYKLNNIDLVTLKRVIFQYKDICINNIEKEFLFNFLLYELDSIPKNLNDILFEIKTIYEIIYNNQKLNKKTHSVEEYKKFITVLNELRSKNLITVQERRKFDDDWNKDYTLREKIMNELNQINNQ